LPALSTEPSPRSRSSAAALRGYEGLVSLSGFDAQYQALNVSIMGGAGAAGTDVLLWAGDIWDPYPIRADIAGGGAARLTILAINDGWNRPFFNATVRPESLARVVAALDQLRRLGSLDMAVNFPWA